LTISGRATATADFAINFKTETNLKTLIGFDTLRARRTTANATAQTLIDGQLREPGVHLFHGITIVENKYVPKKPREVLSAKVVTMFHELGYPEHIAPLQAMLTDHFGASEQVLYVGGAVWMLPETWAKVRKAVSEHDTALLATLGLPLP
jgi:hypothetical protein